MCVNVQYLLFFFLTYFNSVWQSLLLLLSHFSHVWLCATPSLGFFRLEHWSGLPFPSPMHKNEKWKWSRSVTSDSSPTPWTAAYQAPPYMGFSRQEYLSGVPLSSPMTVSRSTHVLTNDPILFLFIANILLCMCTTSFFLFLCCWIFRLLPCLGSLNHAVVNIGVHVSFWIMVSSGYMPREN